MRALLYLLWLAPAAPTELELNPGEGGAAYEADYSQAVNLTARLVDEDGAPVAGERVTFQLERASDPDGTRFVIADPVTAADGVATARLTLVDGRHGGQTFVGADPDGEPYRVVATYAGSPGAQGCDADAGPAGDAGVDDTLCPSSGTVDLLVHLEVPQLTLQPGNEVALGESITLVAQLLDPNGDAPAAGTAVDGDAEQPIEGSSISFFYDLDGNARPSLDERLGSADTDGQGVATFAFVADPAFVAAQNVEDGLHVQFGGDERFALAGASQDLVVTPGPPDPARTLLTVEPEEVPANGFARVTLRARLVDEFNNTYGEDDEAFIVEFTSSAGTLLENAERDPITGAYIQELRAPQEPGTADIQVLVDGAEGSTASVEFLPVGCQCGATRPEPAGLLLLALVWLVRVRRRR